MNEEYESGFYAGYAGSSGTPPYEATSQPALTKRMRWLAGQRDGQASKAAGDAPPPPPPPPVTP